MFHHHHFVYPYSPYLLEKYYIDNYPLSARRSTITHTLILQGDHCLLRCSEKQRIEWKVREVEKEALPLLSQGNMDLHFLFQIQAHPRLRINANKHSNFVLARFGNDAHGMQLARPRNAGLDVRRGLSHLAMKFEHASDR